MRDTITLDSIVAAAYTKRHDAHDFLPAPPAPWLRPLVGRRRALCRGDPPLARPDGARPGRAM